MCIVLCSKGGICTGPEIPGGVGCYGVGAKKEIRAEGDRAAKGEGIIMAGFDSPVRFSSSVVP